MTMLRPVLLAEALALLALPLWSDVAEDQRVVILSGLVANNSRIGAVRRTELILSSIGEPGC